MVRRVFLPGASGSPQFWLPVAQRLGAAESNVLLTYPGFAGVARHPKVNDFEQLTDYVLDQIDVPSVLIAQSMGGIFAVQAALQKADLIRGLVLVATSGGLDLTPFQVRDWRIDYLNEPDVPDWFATTQSQIITETFDQVHCPVLLIWGDQDPISPVVVGQHLQQRFRDAQLHIIAAGEHDLANSHAAQVAVLIQRFLFRLIPITQ